MMRRVKTTWLVLILILVAAAACAPARKPPVTAPQAPPIDWNARITEADGLYAAGHYAALRQALETYREALRVPEHAQAVAEKVVRASLALELRKRDLGILPEETFPDLEAPAAMDPSLSRYAPWIELLDGLPVRVKGSPGFERIGGRTLDEQLDWVAERVPDLDRELGAAAENDDLAAALRLAARAAFAYKFPDQLNAARYLDLHPDSRLAAFEAAMFPAYDFDRLEALLKRDPGFAEVHYFLGEAALLGGKLLTAEMHYLQALPGIPDSASLLISLAKVAFQIEELESCLEWNERALAVLPTYRDALLGMGLALGYLNRNEEALAVLGRLLELGTYYLGEGHFWTAWNLNELGRLEEARRSVESAKVFLVDVVDVYSLSGIIAYRERRLDDAEKELLYALKLHSSESDPAYYLGRIYAEREDWLLSGTYFAGAAMSLETQEGEMENKIAEIEGSEMAPERKARLVARKRAQIRSVQVTKATCQYNGAAGFHNAGSFERALDLARMAAAHPAFAEKASELIKKIQER
jgi:tetratricopeptide (TPR) repeat protein